MPRLNVELEFSLCETSIRELLPADNKMPNQSDPNEKYHSLKLIGEAFDMDFKDKNYVILAPDESLCLDVTVIMGKDYTSKEELMDFISNNHHKNNHKHNAENTDKNNNKNINKSTQLDESRFV